MKDRYVVVLPDNDPPGHRHGQQVADRLRLVAKSVRVLELPELREDGGDVLDWLEAGHTMQELLELAEQAPAWAPESFRISESSILGGSEERRKLRVIPSKEVPLPREGSGDGLLDPFLPDSPALVLLAGESSAGKTVLCYNLAYHLAEGLEFGGLKPQQAVRVLYFDLESPESVHRSLVDTIGRSDNLAFVRSLPQTLNTPEGRAPVLEACAQFGPEVIFFDALPIAWPVRDENDNAEANAQMWEVKRMAVTLHCLCVALWNMGEGNVKEKFRARGATARIDRADLALNYTELTNTTRQLKIVKSRYGTLGLAITLRFACDMGLEAVESNDSSSPSVIVAFQDRLRGLARTGLKTRKQFVDTLGKEDLVDKALARLVQAGELRRVKQGVYELALSSEPPNQGGRDSEEVSKGDWGQV